MKYNITFLLLLLLTGVHTDAQKPFMEGIITYNVVLESAEHQEYKGVYIFTIKDAEIKKELKLSDGYQDVVLINCTKGTVYSLQSKYGRKYAIELSIKDMMNAQGRFSGFTLNNEQLNNRKIAGLSANKGRITYKDGSATEIYYTKEWSPAEGITFERFPGAKFLPLNFSYTDEQGLKMQFDASKVDAVPVENAVFRIPNDYKMISYNEYKELSQ